MVTYPDLTSYMRACAAWFANDGPWTTTEWNRRVTFARIASLPDCNVQDRTIAWALAIGWLRVPPPPCEICQQPPQSQRDTRYPLNVVFQRRCSHGARMISLLSLAPARITDIERFPGFDLRYALEDNHDSVCRELQLSQDTYREWQRKLQSAMSTAVQEACDAMPQVGRDGVIVEIDETLLNKLKPASAAFHRLRRRRAQFWAWAAVERHGITEGRCIIILLAADIDHPRGLDALKDCLQKYVAQGSRIVHDDWGAYRSMPWQDMGFQHDARSVVNHSKEAVNVWGENTNHIESVWSASKRWARKRCGGKLPVGESAVRAFLWEYLWRMQVKFCGVSPTKSLLHLLM